MNFLKYFKFETRLRFRNPSQIFFIFVFPLFLMFAFASSFGRNIPNYIENNIATIMMYAVLSASITSMSVQIAEYQTGKIYSLFNQRGINRLIYIFSQILSFMLIVLFSTIAVLIVAHFGYDYHVPQLSKLLLNYLKLYLYSIPFYFVSIIIGLISKNTTTASAIAMPVMFVSYFLSGMMIPLSGMSGNIRNIANQFFLTQLLSDLTYTLTNKYMITPNWTNVCLSTSLIIIVTYIIYRKKN